MASPDDRRGSIKQQAAIAIPTTDLLSHSLLPNIAKMRVFSKNEYNSKDYNDGRHTGFKIVKRHKFLNQDLTRNGSD